MLFTDGLFEVEDPSGEVFSQEQLLAAANRHADRSPEEFFTRLLQDIHHFSKRESFDDDVCIVGVEVRHTDGPMTKERAVSLTLTHHERSTPEATTNVECLMTKEAQMLK